MTQPLATPFGTRLLGAVATAAIGIVLSIPLAALGYLALGASCSPHHP